MMEEFNHRKYLDERGRYYNIVTDTLATYVNKVGYYDSKGNKEFNEEVDHMDRAFTKWCQVARRLPVEMVRSRRKKFPTARYLSLMEEYKKRTETLEGHITMLILKYR